MCKDEYVLLDNSYVFIWSASSGFCNTFVSHLIWFPPETCCNWVFLPCHKQKRPVTRQLMKVLTSIIHRAFTICQTEEEVEIAWLCFNEFGGILFKKNRKSKAHMEVFQMAPAIKCVQGVWGLIHEVLLWWLDKGKKKYDKSNENDLFP